MKKTAVLLFAALIVLSTRLTYAQDTLKTCARSWTAELNVNPFQGQISLNNALNQIKVRYFTTDKFAYRLAFNINNIRKDNGQSNVYGTSPIENSDIKKSTTFGLNLGFEKHLAGTRRLSPYLGAEIAYGSKNANETIDSKQSTTDIKGGWQSTQVLQYNNGNGTYYYYTTVNNTDNGYHSYGVNLVTGFDYYVAKNFFFGYEMLFGYNYTKYTKIETTYTPKPGQENQTSGNASQPDFTGKEHSFGPKIINGIRLGYTF